jgi:uncharacterized protein
MATIVHFDINAAQPQALARFYETLFGWKIQALNGPVTYHLIQTRDLEGKPGIGGGISQKTEGGFSGMINFVGISSIDEVLKQIPLQGGSVLVGKQVVPGFGYNAICTDPEQNIFDCSRKTVQLSDPAYSFISKTCSHATNIFNSARKTV